jgi:hypothetical protein
MKPAVWANPRKGPNKKGREVSSGLSICLKRFTIYLNRF